MSEAAAAEAASEPMLRVEGLSKSFETAEGPIEVLREIDFEIPEDFDLGSLNADFLLGVAARHSLSAAGQIRKVVRDAAAEEGATDADLADAIEGRFDEWTSPPNDSRPRADRRARSGRTAARRRRRRVSRALGQVDREPAAVVAL